MSKRFAIGAAALFFSLNAQAFAQAAAPVPPPAFSEVLMKMMPMFVVVFVVFHFFIIRPQKTKEAEQQSLLKNLKNGDSVVTSSGIIGRVAGVTPECVTLEVASGVKVRFLGSHIVKKEEAQKK